MKKTLSLLLAFAADPIAYKDYLIESYDLAHAQSVLSGVADVTEENGALKIVLTSDINGRLHIGTDRSDWDGDFVLDLNGHKIETDDTFGEALCLDNFFRGSLTITGSGTIKGRGHQIVYVGLGELRFALADGYNYFTLKVDGDDYFDKKNTETKTDSWVIDGNELVIEQVIGGFDTYTITFDANGNGTAPEAIVDAEEGSKITAPTAPTVPSTPATPDVPEIDATPETPVFADVHTAGHWAKADVDYVFEKGLMKGVSENSFNNQSEG